MSDKPEPLGPCVWITCADGTSVSLDEFFDSFLPATPAQAKKMLFPPDPLSYEKTTLWDYAEPKKKKHFPDIEPRTKQEKMI